jgi:hypothetical protein
VKWVVLLADVVLCGVVVADLVLRRRQGAHRELELAHDRARRAADLAPIVRDAGGYRTAVASRLAPLPAAPQEAFLEGRIRLAVSLGAVGLLVAGTTLALKPHHRSLYLRSTLAGLTKVTDDQATRLLQAQAQSQLASDSGLADPVVGRYGTDTFIAGARVVHGDGVADAEKELARIVGVDG